MGRVRAGDGAAVEAGHGGWAMTSFFRKLTWWVRRRRKDDELREELQFHLDEEADERRGDGLADDQARWAARRDLGNVTMVREDARSVWIWTLGEQLAQDTRYALRTMRRNRTFTALAALSLALGIGANTAIYSFMDSILLRSLPVQEPERLVRLEWNSKDYPQLIQAFIGDSYRDAAGRYSTGVFPYPVFDLFHNENSVFQDLFVFKGDGRQNVIVNGQADTASTF